MKRVNDQSLNKTPPLRQSLNNSEALNRLMGNEALYKKLLTLFIDETPDKIVALNEGVALENVEMIKKVSHALKGTSGNISAKILSECAAELETAAEKADLDNCKTLIQAFENEFMQVKVLVEQY